MEDKGGEGNAGIRTLAVRVPFHQLEREIPGLGITDYQASILNWINMAFKDYMKL